MLITLEEAKQYLRVDTADEDTLIAAMLESAESICLDVARCGKDDLPEDPSPLRVAVLYALAYLFEHREEADHNELMLTLRSLLFSVRKEVF